MGALEATTVELEASGAVVVAQGATEARLTAEAATLDASLAASQADLGGLFEKVRLVVVPLPLERNKKSFRAH